MVRNSPMHVRQNANHSGIKTKHCQRARLRYVVGHYSISQQNKGGPLLIQDGCRCSQTASNGPIFLWNVVVMQAFGFGRTQPGGKPVAACTVAKMTRPTVFKRSVSIPHSASRQSVRKNTLLIHLWCPSLKLDNCWSPAIHIHLPVPQRLISSPSLFSTK